MDWPKKLYINKFMIRPGMLHPAEFPPDNPEQEYIRKEALLKKISELRAIPHDHAMARDNAFIEVIGIIESL